MGGSPTGGIGIARVGGLFFHVRLIFTARDEGRGVLRTEDRQIRIQLVKGIVVLLMIVESHHIHRMGDIQRREKAIVHRGAHRTRGIESLHRSHQAAGHFVADLRALEGLFVENRPHKNRRVVSVATDHPLELANVFRRGVEISHLVHDEHSQAVADVKEFCRRRVVRATNGIHTHFLELSNAKFPHSVRHSHTDTCVVLVDAGTLNLERLIVEVKTGLGIKPQSAEAAGRGGLVENAVAVFDDCFHRIHGRRVHRPEAWFFDRQSELGCGFAQ